MPRGPYDTTGKLDFAIFKLLSDRFYSYCPVVPWDDREPLPATQGALPRHSGSLMRTIRVAAGLVCHYELLGHLLGHLVQRDTWRSRISNWGESLCGFYHNTKTASEISRLTAQSISRTFQPFQCSRNGVKIEKIYQNLPKFPCLIIRRRMKAPRIIRRSDPECCGRAPWVAGSGFWSSQGTTG